MKIINYILISTLILAFFSCEEDVTNPEFAEDAIPAIHVDWQSQMALDYGDTIKYAPQVSPSDGAVYEWLLNDEVISNERELVYKVEQEGELTLKFRVTRNGVENSRTGTLIVVKPFEPKEYNKKMVGFITTNGSPEDVQWDEITHLVVSSATVQSPDMPVDTTFADAEFDIGTLVSTAHNYGVYVLLDVTGKINYQNAIGSWGELGFYNTVIDEVKRNKLIEDVLLFVENNGFDGINLYLNNTSLGPSFEDPDAVTAFFNQFAESLPQEGPNGEFFFTASVPGGWTASALSMVAAIDRFDWYHVMAIGGYDLTPVHHASMWSFTSQADAWINHGASAEELVMVFPAFGVHYAFPEGVDITWGNVDLYVTWPGFREILTIDPDAETKNVVDQDDGIFYDGHNEVGAKAQYILDNGLGGLAVWSLENDSKDPGKSLSVKAKMSLGN